MSARRATGSQHLKCADRRATALPRVCRSLQWRTTACSGFLRFPSVSIATQKIASGTHRKHFFLGGGGGSTVGSPRRKETQQTAASCLQR
eukprot:1324856-Alexandrium_andersonii.AAC.1